jgi:cytoskeletal protein CcmA (bactofilin family)
VNPAPRHPLLRFLHRDRNTVVPARAVQSLEIGVLGLDSRVQGHVKFEGTLTVDGTVTGDLRAPEGSGAMLVVGQSATIVGDIVSDSVLIGGRVTGSVKAKERVEIFGTGVLHGDIETGDIMIQGGAEFQGNCHMLKDAPLVSDEIAGLPPKPKDARGNPAAGDARRAKKTKGARTDTPDPASRDAAGANGANGEAAGGTQAGSQSMAVPQDSRTERGSTAEGPLA